MGLTQLQFAEMLGISRNYVYMLENGVKPLTAKMRGLIANSEQEKCSHYANSSASSGMVREDPCHCPAGVDQRLAAMEADLATIRAQLETVTGLLSGALRSGLEKRKAG